MAKRITNEQAKIYSDMITAGLKAIALKNSIDSLMSDVEFIERSYSVIGKGEDDKDKNFILDCMALARKMEEQEEI